MTFTRAITSMWRWAAPWTPLSVLLLMALVSAVILSTVVNCSDSVTGVKERSNERVCIRHYPQVTPMLRPDLKEGTVLERLQHQPFSELSGRLAWSISILFFALTATFTFVAILRTIIDGLESPKLLLGIIIIFVVAGVITVRSLPPGQTFEFNNTFLTGTVFRVAPAEDFVDAVEFTGPMLLVGLSIAVSLILLRASRMSVSTPELPTAAIARTLAAQQTSVRLLLYVGALTLVAGTLQASALYSWAMSMLTQPEGVTYASKLSDIPQAMGILNGAFYSIFLAGIFVPAIAQLRAQAHRLADMAMPDAPAAERNKWLEENAVAGTLPRQLVSAVAVTAPLLAGGPLVALLEAIGG